MSSPRLSAGYLISLSAARRAAFQKSLKPDEARNILHCWRFWARDEQLPPEGDWRIWLFLGGRGAGKTRSGAQWVAEGVAQGTMHRIGLIGATFNDARAVMIEGVAGLKAVSDGAMFEPANRRVLWPSGAVASVLSADAPDGIRGHQFDAIWADEFAKWPDPQGALDMALMSLRLGANPRMAITTTPRNIAALKDLMASPDVVLSRGATAANAANLAPGFLETMQSRYAGSRLGRQELDAELIEDNDAAQWRRAWIDDNRVREAPELAHVVVAVDPPATSHGDECGIIVAGRSVRASESDQNKDDAYVLADLSSGGLTPNQWAARVADAYTQYEADAVIAEANQGGDMVKSVLLEAQPNLPVKLVRATRGKQTRAAPFAALYEAGRVHHVGALPELEDQMCAYDGTRPKPRPHGRGGVGPGAPVPGGAQASAEDKKTLKIHLPSMGRSKCAAFRVGTSTEQKTQPPPAALRASTSQRWGGERMETPCSNSSAAPPVRPKPNPLPSSRSPSATAPAGRRAITPRWRARAS
jgi:phage terminase large subunit-like protein